MQFLRRLRARALALDPQRADLVLAAILGAALVIECTLIPTEGFSRALSAAFGVAAVVPAMALRRSKPLVAVLIFVGVLLAAAPVGTFLLVTGTTPFIVALVLCYSLGRHQTGRRFWVGAVALIPVMWVVFLLEPGAVESGDFIWTVFLFTPPMLAGRALRSRAMLQAELREKAERSEAEREVRAAQAVEEERRRIAGELQALVANGVSAMVVQAEAVPRVLAAGESARAREAFEVIEETGRDALIEMRRLLGVLRREGEKPALAPQPGLAMLDALAERVREAGLELSVELRGERRPLPAGVDLAAYRVLQRDLDLALAGGASTAAVILTYGDRDLELVVLDDRAEREPAPGLAALRDRVGLYGGHVRATAGEAGFRLELVLPVRPAAPTASGSPA
jgi:signal transduction histidine kinase